MQETELRFPSLKTMMQFKQQSGVKELRLDTNDKSLTGRFSEEEITQAVKSFKGIVFSEQFASAEGVKSGLFLM